MTGPGLIRWSGLAAIVAGILFIAIQPLHPPETLDSLTTSTYAILHSLPIAMSLFSLAGLAGLYARQVKEAGWLGLAGFLLLGLWLVLVTAFTFAEAFILPPLTQEAPKFVVGFMGLSAGAASEVNLGAIELIYGLGGALYLIGGALFGIASFRARILSRWGAGLFAFAPVAAIVSFFVPQEYAPLAAVPTGLGLAMLGYSLWSNRAATTTQEVQA